MAKSSSPQVDLDGDEKLRDYGDQTPFLPFGESEVDGDLVFFSYHDGYKGKAYRAKIKITKSDRDDVKVGKVFCLHFKLEGKPDAKRAKMKELRQFVAAIMKQDAASESFKANDAMATLNEASSAEALDGSGFGLHISSRDKPATNENNEPILNKDGSQKHYTNRYYQPLGK